jgi:hypothetical protein
LTNLASSAPKESSAESLDVRIEDEDLDGAKESAELREALERLQALSLEISEALDTYQDRYARYTDQYKGGW